MLSSNKDTSTTITAEYRRLNVEYNCIPVTITINDDDRPKVHMFIKLIGKIEDSVKPLLEQLNKLVDSYISLIDADITSDFISNGGDLGIEYITLKPGVIINCGNDQEEYYFYELHESNRNNGVTKSLLINVNIKDLTELKQIHDKLLDILNDDNIPFNNKADTIVDALTK